MRSNVLPVSVNWEFPDRRVNVTGPPVATAVVNVQDEEFVTPVVNPPDVEPDDPPNRSRCRTGLLTGLLKVIVIVPPAGGTSRENEGTPGTVPVYPFEL